MDETRTPLIRGTLTPLILKSLSWGPLHGYAIATWIQDRTASVLQVEEGVLYPALHRLERDGLLDARWGRNDTGRRAKFYSLTAEGSRQLAQEIAQWRRTSDAVNTVLDATGA
ncbi:MAG TPA: PadR family transcriptional regulator [Longimicrobiales bacterium]|nr:PadR family transcriptional regulator [Longimicrobiales bacterium]